MRHQCNTPARNPAGNPATYPAPTLGERIRAAVKAITARLPAGEHQPPIVRKVKDGERDAGQCWEALALYFRRAGVDYETARPVFVLPLRFLDRVYGRFEGVRDLATASYNETRAQCAADPLQLRAALATGDAQRVETLKALLPRLYYQQEATAEMIAAAEQELQTLESERVGARQLLGVA